MAGRTVERGMSTKKPRRSRVPALNLTPEEQETLQRYERGRSVSQALALRARIILRCAGGQQHKVIAEDLGIDADTVGNWRRRFAASGIAGLSDLPKPNVHRKLSDERVEEVIRSTLDTLPKGCTHWSTRKMSRASGVSQSTISRIWRAFQLKPHRQRTFTLSTDDFFVEKVRDIVGLYMSPPDHAVVLCLDEKSQIQALNRTQPVLPLVFGQSARATATYSRHGITNLFAALDIATGKVIGECYPKKRGVEFRRFLARVHQNVPEPLGVHLVVDNSSIHNTPEVRAWLRRNPRFRLHFTPTYSSWLNLVERWFANLTEDALRRATHLNTHELCDAIESYVAATNDEPKPFRWTKSADEIIASVSRFCARTLDQSSNPRFTDSGH